MRDLGLTLAGGGNRAFWQLGILERWWPELSPRLGAVAACSAGASMAVTWLSGRQDATHRYWLGRRSHVTRNFEWGRLLTGRRPTPHEPIYRDTLRHALADGGLERIHALPFPLLILTASFPQWMPVPFATAAGMTAYSIERQLRMGKLHPRSGRLIGFRPLVVDARTCPEAEDLVDLVLASSATPPFTAIGRHRGRRLLDGGMVDNAPAFVAEQGSIGRNLVLLTRPYPSFVASSHRLEVTTPGLGTVTRLYLCPTEPVPINRWDYTSVERVEATVQLGRLDADRHAGEISRLLGQ